MVKVSFEQRYQSGNYSDVVHKQLEWVKEGGDWKIRHGRSKYVFIETFKDLLPKSLHRRPKWGFEMPVSRWLKTDLHGLIDTYLARERIEKQGIFNYPVIEDLVRNLMHNRTDSSWQLWNLIAFQAWYDSHMQ